MPLEYPILSAKTKEFLERPFIQRQVQEALSVIEDDPCYATPNLAKWFRQNRSLGSRDRKIVSEILYCLIRFQDFFLAHSLHSFERKIQILREDLWKRDLQSEEDITSIRDFISLPQWIVEEWKEQLGLEELIQLCQHLQSRAPIDLRINPTRTSQVQLQRDLEKMGIESEKILGTRFGLRVHQRLNLNGNRFYQRGHFDVQDAASQLFCEAIPLKDGMTIFDMCSGAGGKSLTLAALYPKARIYANDPRSNARKELRKRSERAQANIHIGRKNIPFDCIVIDAPCSGIGRLRREPAIRYKWKEKDILEHVQIQQDLLLEASQMPQNKGLLVYATCSLLKAENEHDLIGWSRETHYIWPHQHNGDGFSYSIYRKDEENARK